jgi:hypothetical protein
LSPDLKGLESGVREPSYKEYMVSVDMSYQAGPNGQGQNPVTQEALQYHAVSSLDLPICTWVGDCGPVHADVIIIIEI